MQVQHKQYLYKQYLYKLVNTPQRRGKDATGHSCIKARCLCHLFIQVMYRKYNIARAPAQAAGNLGIELTLHDDIY